MAVRVMLGELPDSAFATADGFEVVAEDHLYVTEGDKRVAVFHRNHWAKAEIVAAESDKA